MKHAFGTAVGCMHPASMSTPHFQPVAGGLRGQPGARLRRRVRLQALPIIDESAAAGSSSAAHGYFSPADTLMLQSIAVPVSIALTNLSLRREKSAAIDAYTELLLNQPKPHQRSDFRQAFKKRHPEAG